MGIQYKYAYDEHDNLVCIHDVDNLYRDIHSFTCLSCGRPLSAKLGKIKAHHFAHKNNLVCDRNRYLHKLGQIILKKRWDESPSFMVSFRKHSEKWCNKAQKCIFKSDCCSQITEEQSVDLKKYYQSCTIEKSYNGYVADLLVEDTNGNKKPIMLEVAVTHPCSEEKKTSGIYIIEFGVQSEEQAISLGGKKISCLQGEKFYGFNYRQTVDYSLDNISYQDEYNEKIVKATLFENGYIDIDYINCRDIDQSQIGNAIAIAFFKPSGGWHPFEYAYKPYDERWSQIRRRYHLRQAKSLFAQTGYNIKSCHYCKYYNETNSGEKICFCYKKYGTPKNPKSNHAFFCRLYRTKFEQIPNILLECASITQHATARNLYPKTPAEDPDKNNLFIELGVEIYNQLFDNKSLDHWGVEEYEPGIKDGKNGIYLHSKLGWIEGILIKRTSGTMYAVLLYFSSDNNICLTECCDSKHVYTLIDDYLRKNNPNTNLVNVIS